MRFSDVVLLLFTEVYTGPENKGHASEQLPAETNAENHQVPTHDTEGTTYYIWAIAWENLQLANGQNFRFVLFYTKIIFKLYMTIILDITVTCRLFTEIWHHKHKWSDFHVTNSM